MLVATALACISLFAPAMLPETAAIAPPAGEVEPTASIATNQKIFDFRNGFWINLHHFLYLQAMLATPDARKGHAEESAQFASPAMTDAQKAVWDKAVQFYLKYGKRDALTDDELVQVNYELSDAGNSATLQGRALPPALKSTLEAVAPVYRALWWSEHDRRNRAWISAAAKLVAEYGLAISKRLAAAYQTEWPKERTTVEVVMYANWAGAYTVTNGTLITISSTDSQGQDQAALENLFHEISHALIDHLQGQLYTAIRAKGKKPGFDVVHVIIFFTAGVVTTEALAGRGVHDFTPYAIQYGLYERVPGWKRDQDICEKDWRPYLEGKTTFNAALARIAEDL